MNWEKLLSCLTDDEVDKLHSLVWKEYNLRVDHKVGKMPYPSFEVNSKMSKIKAIKAYKNRVGCGLLLAKKVIDRYFV